MLLRETLIKTFCKQLILIQCRVCMQIMAQMGSFSFFSALKASGKGSALFFASR
jgi:hypothetical protein